ncbi:VWA domain-containing protein [Alteromonas gilva]|uniref:VWA domain-containing protein n=1 Tax=Alteromonas gilva TaxID=2987522 RepID=A0ABT5L8L1_9ALTE|nr:VWA domain-containing protein [Alteromonas gilva]MDC8832931.1 VWA domain-containing protein [Alteromonas gilva]
MNARSFIQRAKALATLMTSRQGVEVTIGGNQAFSQGGRINLPNGDFTDPEWVAMIQGWIDHELGHEKHTDHNIFASSGTIDPALQRILNQLEDARMEKCVGDEFPGAKTNLSQLVGLAIKRELFGKPSAENASHALSCFILYHARRYVVGQHALNDYANEAERICREVMGDDLVDAIKAEIESTAKAKNTHDAFEISKRIYDLIKEEEEKPEDDSDESDQQDDSNESDSDSEDQEGSDESEGDSEGQGDSGDSGESDENEDDTASGDGSGKSEEGSDEQESDSGSGENEEGDNESEETDTGNGEASSGDELNSEESQAPGDSETSDEGQSGQKSEGTMQQLKAALKGFLEDTSTDDFHEKLAELLEVEASEASEECREYDGFNVDVRKQLLPCNNYPLPKEHKQLANRFYQTLYKVIFDNKRSLPVTRTVGSKLLNNKLSGIPAGNLSVFKQGAYQRVKSSAISILVDASGSMNTKFTDKENMYHANTSALALATTFSRMQIDCEVNYFGVWDESDYANYIYKAKPFGQPLTAKRFGVAPTGGTPTHEGMLHAIQSLALKRDERKILFIITDGQANSSRQVEKMVEVAKQLNIKLIPIGLGQTSIRGFDVEDFVSASDMNEVNEALRNAIKQKLFA